MGVIWLIKSAHENRLVAIYLNQFEKALIFDTNSRKTEWTPGGKRVSISIFTWDRRDPCFDAGNFDARNFDARNFDARNWMQLSPGRWGKRGPYFRPTSHPDLKSHTSLHHHHNNRLQFSEQCLTLPLVARSPHQVRHAPWIL